MTSSLEQKWGRRLDRERRARIAAEDLLEAKSRELYASHVALRSLAAELEERVCERTRELADAQLQAVSLAERDQLTGIANRMVFVQMLEEAIARYGRTRRSFALLLIDLDNFKDVNDLFGHEAGDVLLQEIAARLGGCVRAVDTVARLGGDEFAALIADCPSISDLHGVADRMIEAVRRPILHRQRRLEVSCSIGIAVYPDHAGDSADLQRHADLALYRSKTAGRAVSSLFDDGLRREFDERHVLGAQLKDAIAARRIIPYFQPITDALTGAVKGVEALARWDHPERGVVGPGVFLGLAEERKLVGDLFAGMLRETCRTTAPWLAAGVIRSVSINVSPSQFRSTDLVETVLRILAEEDYPHAAVTIEITEEVLLHDLGRVALQLSRLSETGIRVALDDFGVGYSNIAYLRRLPIHVLKLDRLLTSDVVSDAKARSVLGGIIAIARALELEVVAEGVETREQAEWLGHLGCQKLQGYLFGKPMRAEDSAARELRGRAA